MNIIEEKKNLRTVLVGLELKSSNNSLDIINSLDELEELANACDYHVVNSYYQKRDRVESSTYIGMGKIEEISSFVKSNDVELVIFDDELSGIQIRNLSNIFDVDVIDRTNLILEIFSNRANSAAGKLQVELAKLKYSLPRLIGLRDSLSKSGGGSAGVFAKGLGEKKLELDRRYIKSRILDYEKRLDKLSKSREIQRKSRNTSSIKKVALVGYTNAGKSSLLNKFLDLDISDRSEDKTLEKDMLFATLDPLSKKIDLGDNKKFILSDTVGFINKLPHNLVEAFKSTLEELPMADLLLFVIDISDKNYPTHLRVINEILKEVKADKVPHLIVYNKIDLIEEIVHKSIPFDEYELISIKNSINIDKLINKLDEKLFSSNKTYEIFIPYKDAAVLDRLHKISHILSQDFENEGYLLKINIDNKYFHLIHKFII